MEFQKVMQELKQKKLQPIYTVIGHEIYLKEQFYQQLEQTLGGEENVDISRFDLNEHNIQEVLDESETFSFFAQYRLLYVSNVFFLASSASQKISEYEQNQLLSYLSNPNPSTIVVFIFDQEQLDKRRKLSKAFNKETTMVDASELNEGEVTRYIQDYIKETGIDYTRDAVHELLTRVNYKFSTAMNEIEKLNVYAKSQGQVNIETIRQLVPRTLESNVFELTNAVAGKQIERAMEIYQDLLLMRNEPIALHALLVSQFRIIIQALILAQGGHTEGSIAGHLNVHPYRVKLALQASRSMKLSELLNFYVELCEVDYQMKTGIGIKDSHFSILLTKLNRL